MILPSALDDEMRIGGKEDNQLRERYACLCIEAYKSGYTYAKTAKKENAYHRFVKTTPKPRATKKRSGELEPLLLLLLLVLFVLEGMAVCGLVTSDDVAVADCVVVVAALTTIWATSPRTWSITAMVGYLLQSEQRWQAAAMDSRPWFVFYTCRDTDSMDRATVIGFSISRALQRLGVVGALRGRTMQG